MGKILNIFGIIFLIIILIMLGTAFYFYQFYVFKTTRVCISNNAEDSKIPCSSNEQCVNLFLNNMTGMKEKINEIPEIFKPKITEAINSAVFCEQTCKVKNIYGSGFGGVEEVESCKPGEKEISLKIRGKEGLQLLKYMWKNKTASSK